MSFSGTSFSGSSRSRTHARAPSNSSPAPLASRPNVYAYPATPSPGQSPTSSVTNFHPGSAHARLQDPDSPPMTPDEGPAAGPKKRGSAAEASGASLHWITSEPTSHRSPPSPTGTNELLPAIVLSPADQKGHADSTGKGGMYLHGNDPSKRNFHRVRNALRMVFGRAMDVRLPGLPSVPKPLTFGRHNRNKSTSGAAVREKKLEKKLARSGKGRRRDWRVVIGLIMIIALIMRYGWKAGSSAGEVAMLTRESIRSTSAGIPRPASIDDLPVARVPSERVKRVPASSQAAAPVASAESVVQAGSYDRHPEINGLLAVNMSLPSNKHPIYQLILEGKAKWAAKVARQSKTLKEAVEEYKRRNHGLNPPKGFDKWWEFVVENDVPLPDEYDQISQDMYIFRALSPADLNARIHTASQYPDTFTISVRNGAIRTRSSYSREIYGADERLEGQLGLLTEFDIQKWLPDVKVVMGVHDTPTGFISYAHKRELMDHVEDNEYIDPHDEVDTSVRGWAAACSSTSAARSFDLNAAPSTSKHAPKTFIANHHATFDLCVHPDSMPLHGVTTGRNPVVDGGLKPVWSLSKTSLNTDVVAVPVEGWTEEMGHIDWEERTEDRLMWRGSNTGAYYSVETAWRDSHRPRLVAAASKNLHDQISILSAPSAESEEGGTLEDTVLRADKGPINDRFLDIAFGGEPIQCNEEDGTCQELDDEYDFKRTLMTHDEALQYKYIVDIDGNAWSARFRRLLAGGALILKSTIMPEWWTQRAQPWVHYVPLKLDYSDMHDIMTFFRGDIYGRGGEEALAQEIAQTGFAWGRTHWRRADMAAYTARLYLEWARLQAPNRAAADFVYHPDMELTRV